MKIHDRQIKLTDLVKLCEMSNNKIRYHLRRLQKHFLINKTYPRIYSTNPRMEYIISERGINLLNQFEKNILTYHNMDGTKEQLETFNN